MHVVFFLLRGIFFLVVVFLIGVVIGIFSTEILRISIIAPIYFVSSMIYFLFLMLQTALGQRNWINSPLFDAKNGTYPSK